MRHKKQYLFGLLVVVFAGLLLFAETKQTVSHQKEFKVSADTLWGMVGNFASAEAFGKNDLKFEFEGSGVGMTRKIVFPNGFYIAEKLESLDEGNKTLTYSIFNNPKLPYKNYVGTLTVESKGDSSCILIEDVTYKTKIWQRKMAKKSLLYFISTTFDNLAKTIE